MPLSSKAIRVLSDLPRSIDGRVFPLSAEAVKSSWLRTVKRAHDRYHNTLGQQSSLTYPDGLVVATTPNALGQPSQAGSYASSIAYFANGGMSGFTYGNGIVHSLTQNLRELPLRSLD